MASITIHDLSYKTPEGRTLFDHLDLTFAPVRTGLVGRNGTCKSTLLALIGGRLTPLSGGITITGTIGLMRQLVQVDPGMTIARLAGVEAELARLNRIERGDGSEADFAEADWTLPSRLAAAWAELGLPELSPDRPAATLSGGQQTRATLAGLLLQEPDFLLIDEPTNNLDTAGRTAITDLLSRWRGGAVVVSHDRALLRQMDNIVELTSLDATSYGGDYDFYRERKAGELEAAAHALAHAERKLADVEHRAQVQAERQARRNSAGRRAGRGGGAPRIVLGGLKRGAEETAAREARLASRQREVAVSQADKARDRIEILQPLTVSLASTHLPAGRQVLEACGLTGGPPGRDSLITGLDLTITGPERVAITGPNGAGKTTLLKLLTGALPLAAGRLLLTGRHALLDQSVSLLDPATTIRENYRRLNPGEDENACRAALARFRFRADAALQLVGTLSGGEMLRAGLAATIGSVSPPELLFLDEPTNHLDLEATEAVEVGLSAYDGALLVVSHDRDFLEAIGITREICLPAA